MYTFESEFHTSETQIALANIDQVEQGEFQRVGLFQTLILCTHMHRLEGQRIVSASCDTVGA